MLTGMGTIYHIIRLAPGVGSLGPGIGERPWRPYQFESAVLDFKHRSSATPPLTRAWSIAYLNALSELGNFTLMSVEILGVCKRRVIRRLKLSGLGINTWCCFVQRHSEPHSFHDVCSKRDCSNNDNTQFYSKVDFGRLTRRLSFLDAGQATSVSKG